jgi:hypothetical protein
MFSSRSSIGGLGSRNFKKEGDIMGSSREFENRREEAVDVRSDFMADSQ